MSYVPLSSLSTKTSYRRDEKGGRGLIIRYKSHNTLNPTNTSNNRIKYPNTR
jgi:hypothetical protein